MMRDIPPDDLQHGLISAPDSEASVVAILLNYPGANDECESLEPTHFTDHNLRLLFATIRDQHGKGPYDVVTIAQKLDGEISVQEVHAYSGFYANFRTIGKHVKNLIDSAKSRKLFEVAQAINAMAYEQTPVQERIERAASLVSGLEDKEDFGEWISAHESAIKHLDVLEDREAGVKVGMGCGIPALNDMLGGGFHRGTYVVIGARPAMGKSALALTLGLHLASDYTVGFISMEMSRTDIADRQAAILGRVPLSHVKQPKRGLEYSRIVDAVESSKHRRFYVVEQGGLNILQIRAKAKALKRRHGLDVLVIDYIGLMSGLDSKQSRAYQIEEISRNLKSLAKEMDIAILCLAQVNRASLDKGNHPPSLHDLRDSGSLEQDADTVAFIHRPIAGNPELGPDFERYALLRVAKNRQGRTGDVHLYYEAERTFFCELEGLPPNAKVQAQSRLKASPL